MLYAQEEMFNITKVHVANKINTIPHQEVITIRMLLQEAAATIPTLHQEVLMLLQEAVVQPLAHQEAAVAEEALAVPAVAVAEVVPVAEAVEAAEEDKTYHSPHVISNKHGDFF